MDNNIIDMNKMAASIYNTVLSLQNTATKLVGIDALWCRALPYENSEDVIVQEYTLSNVECPQRIKVITDKAEYQVGLYTFGALGIDFDTDLTVNINIPEWEELYGKGTMPQKGDIVILELIHRAYEVASSQVVYTLSALPTSFKCTLAKYARQASRKESEDFKTSIDELTNSQDRLFGDEISKEVADAVVEVETSYNQSTLVDPIKDFDINSIITDTIKLYKGNIITNAYYDFSVAKQNILYHIDAEYKIDVKENHWIYSTWFKIEDNKKITDSFKFKDIYLKEKTYWHFTFNTALQLSVGDQVTLTRGRLLRINGIIDNKACNDDYTIKILTSDCLSAQKTVKDWYNKNSTWQIEKDELFNLLTGNYEGNDILSLNVSSDNVYIRINEINKKIHIDKDILGSWTYITFDINPDSISVIIVINQKNEKTHKIKEIEVLNDFINVNLTDFNIDSFGINNSGQHILMTNIRLYENEYDIDDTYKLDMYSNVTRNANKLILVDTPNAANNMRFISPLK